MFDQPPLPDLPDHWEVVMVEDVVENISLSGSKIKKGNYLESGALPVIDQGEEFIGGYTDKRDLEVDCDLPVVVFGDHTREFKYVDFEFAAGADGVQVLKPSERFEAKLFYHFAMALPLPDKGYARHYKYLRNAKIPLPPLSEQRRIVAKIEELFSNLDVGMDDLQAAGQQLERYRLSVLQAAVEGRLTADWRRTHDPEPADQLLEQILEERQEDWKKQYRWERYDSKGKKPPSGWKSRYKEPVRLEDLEELRELPNGWKWTSLHHLCRWSNGDGLPKKKRDGGPYPVYGGNGVTGSHSEYMIEDSAIVVGRVGAHCGNVHIAPSESWVTDNAIYSKWKSDLVDERFLLLQLRTKGLNQLAGGSGQPYISQKVLKSLPIALPPLAEQKQIVDEAERLLSVADDAAATVEREQTRAERLRQSILKQAFSGRLVRHDEDADPPAVEASPTDGSASSASGDTGSSSDEDDVIAEELYNGGDPGKQIEMDL
jgi:type I restriction enzyme S subunit